MEKRFVPQPAAVGDHNWCVPYAMATVLGKSYDEVYNKTCDIIGKRFRGLGRGDTVRALKFFGVETKYYYHWQIYENWIKAEGIAYKQLPPHTLYHIETWIKAFKKYLPEVKDVRYFLVEVTGHEMLWDDKDKLVIDNWSKKWVKPQDHRWKRKQLQAYAPVFGIDEIKPKQKHPNVIVVGPYTPPIQEKPKGPSRAAKEKKVYYNRVRRTCKKYGIKITYTGEHKNYTAVHFHIPVEYDDTTTFGIITMNVNGQDINWAKAHWYLKKQGFKGGVK